MDEELRQELAAIRAELALLTGLVNEFLPQIRAYLDPEQAGPRGYFMRRRLAATNGADHG